MLLFSEDLILYPIRSSGSLVMYIRVVSHGDRSINVIVSRSAAGLDPKGEVPGYLASGQEWAVQRMRRGKV